MPKEERGAGWDERTSKRERGRENGLLLLQSAPEARRGRKVTKRPLV